MRLNEQQRRILRQLRQKIRALEARFGPSLTELRRTLNRAQRLPFLRKSDRERMGVIERSISQLMDRLQMLRGELDY